MSKIELEYIIDKIGDVTIITDMSDGFINISHIIHHTNKRYSNWTRLLGVNDYIDKVKIISKYKELERKVKGKSKELDGKYIHYLLAIAYAEWCSPIFHIEIIELVRKYNEGNLSLIKDIMERYNIIHNTNSQTFIYTNPIPTTEPIQKQISTNIETMNEVYIRNWEESKGDIIFNLEEKIAEQDKIIKDQENSIKILQDENNKLYNDMLIQYERAERMYIDCEGKSITDIITGAIDYMGDDQMVLTKLRGIDARVKDLKISIDKKISEMIEAMKKDNPKLPKTQITPVSILESKQSNKTKKSNLIKNGFSPNSIIFYIYAENIPELAPAHSIALGPPLKDKEIKFSGSLPNKSKYYELCLLLGAKYNIYNNSNATLYHKTEFKKIEKTIKEFIKSLEIDKDQ